VTLHMSCVLTHKGLSLDFLVCHLSLLVYLESVPSFLWLCLCYSTILSLFLGKDWATPNSILPESGCQYHKQQQ